MFIYSLGLAKEQKKTVQTLRPSNAPPPTATQARALSFILRTDLTTMACLVLLMSAQKRNFDGTFRILEYKADKDRTFR